jgi:hypothetical protein
MSAPAFSVICPEYETKVLLQKLQLFPLDIDKLVIEYECANGNPVAIGFYLIPPLQMDRIHNMWETPGGKLVIEAQYDHKQDEWAKSSPSSDIFWELPVPKHSCPSFIEPILIQDCGNRGEASIRRMSSGQTLRFYNDREEYVPDYCWKCGTPTTYQKKCKKTHSLAYRNIPKVMDLDSNHELKKEEIGDSYYTIGNRWSEEDDNIAVCLGKHTEFPEGGRQRLKHIHLSSCNRSSLCRKQTAHGHLMGIIRDRCSRDGSVVAVLVGHSPSTNSENHIPCSVGIWTKENENSFTLHSSLDFSNGLIGEQNIHYMGFLHFMSSEYLLVSILESLTDPPGWSLCCSLIHIQSQECKIIRKRNINLLIDNTSWRLDTLCFAEKLEHELEMLLIFTQRTKLATKSSGLVRIPFSGFNFWNVAIKRRSN